MAARVWVAVACLVVAGSAWADDDAGVSLGIEATIGAQHLGITRAPGMDQALAPMGDYGGTVLLTVGALALGAAAEGTYQAGRLQRFNASALGGFAVPLFPVVRLELLGELGAANLHSADDLRAAAGSGSWDRFYGLRPGLSVKFPTLPFRFGAWGLARWGLPGSGKGPEYGLLGRLGLEF